MVASSARDITISFTVQQPSGKPLTEYRTGPGPHTGVHLIIVRDDLAYIIHQHPPVGANGLLRQTVTFPAPGTYRVQTLVDSTLADEQELTLILVDAPGSPAPDATSEAVN